MNRSIKLILITLFLFIKLQLLAIGKKQILVDQILDQYWFSITIISLGMIFVIFFAILVIKMNIEYKKAIQDLQHEIKERKEAEKQKQALLNDLEAINSELKNFAYIVSHDLKAPLRAIDSLAHWILKDYAESFDEEGKKQMNLIIGRVGRMHNLIEGILEYSRVGRAKENMVEIDLNLLLVEVIDLIAPPENIQVIIENEFPTIIAEEVRIKQVFQNLISNAVKFMDKEKGIIKLSCRHKEDEWLFCVSDNGLGIEEKYFDKIFGIFQTLVSRDTFENTGIGLSLIKKIISIYGGEVWVESEVGKGSSFNFTIPENIKEK